MLHGRNSCLGNTRISWASGEETEHIGQICQSCQSIYYDICPARSTPAPVGENLFTTQSDSETQTTTPILITQSWPSFIAMISLLEIILCAPEQFEKVFMIDFPDARARNAGGTLSSPDWPATPGHCQSALPSQSCLYFVDQFNLM